MENEHSHSSHHQSGPQQREAMAHRSDMIKKRQLHASDVMYAMRRHLALIIVCSVVGMVLGIVLSFVSYMRGEMSKQYAIKSSISITSQNKNGLFTTDSDNPNSNDFHLAEDMVDAVIYVLKSDRTMNAVVKRIDSLGASARDISNNMNIQQYNDTQIIEITLYWRTAQEGVEILEALNAVAPSILIETLKIGGVAVINPPTSRYLIGGSLNAALWGYMMVLGLLAGIAFSILDLLMRPTILSPSDVEKDFQIEVLGEIPEKTRFFRKKRNILLSNDDDELNTDVLDNYTSLAYIIKTRLQKMDHPCIYVTSASPNEGKTTVTAYLASFLAELGMRVLLIDCDLRNPRLGGLFLSNVEYDHSVNALYRGESTREDAITSLTGNLDILPAVLERLTMPFDDAMRNMIRDLKPDYDVILMDTAPVGKVADTMGLNELADLTLLVIRFDGASMDVIRDAIVRLDKSGIRIMGCIVNGVRNLRRERSTYGNYYGRYTASTRPSKLPEKSELKKEWEEWEKENGKGKTASDPESDLKAKPEAPVFEAVPKPKQRHNPPAPPKSKPVSEESPRKQKEKKRRGGFFLRRKKSEPPTSSENTASAKASPKTETAASPAFNTPPKASPEAEVGASPAFNAPPKASPEAGAGTSPAFTASSKITPEAETLVADKDMTASKAETAWEVIEAPNISSNSG